MSGQLSRFALECAKIMFLEVLKVNNKRLYTYVFIFMTPTMHHNGL